MKKFIGILIAAILLFTTTFGMCDAGNSTMPFTAGLTSLVVPDNALEIITSDVQRALLTVCLALDFGLCDDGKDFMGNNFGSFIINDTYVASDGTFLAVFGYADGKGLNMFYYPETKEASFYLKDTGLSDEFMDLLVKTTAETLSLNYKNDTATLLKVVKAVKEATGK